MNTKVEVTAMILGEVGLLTNNVKQLADFYKRLLEVDNGSEDLVHQSILAKETMLTIYNDGSVKNNANQNICLVFTVDDIEAHYQKLQEMGVTILEKPTVRPWGAISMSFLDPDKNTLYMRSFIAHQG